MPGGGSNGPTDGFAPDADYHTDHVGSYVWDRSLEPLNEIGKILGMISQTRAEEFVNDGAYIALVDEDQEEQGEDKSGPSAQGQSAAGQATELVPWIVEALRSSATAPQTTRVWVPFEDDGQGGPAMAGTPTVFAKAVVTKGVTSTNPYGAFDMHYAMHESEDLGSAVFQKGSLHSVDGVAGFRGFGFVSEDTMFSFGSAVEVRVANDDSRGFGRVMATEPDWEGGGLPITVEYLIAYNEDTFARKEVAGGELELFLRDQFDSHAWRYGLYHASGANAGDRVELNGGFPISAVGGHGWADYWGIWTEPGFDLDHGDVVSGHLSDGSDKNFTVVAAPGRLMRVERQTIALAELDGATFEYWTWDEQLQQSTQLLVQYTHDLQSGSGEWWATATWDEENHSWSGKDSQQDDFQITLQPGEWLHLWSQSLGGGVEFVEGDTEVHIRKHTFVSGDDSLFNGGTTLELYGVSDCLRSGITAAEANSGDVFLDPAGIDLQNPVNYQFQQSDRSLYLDAALVGLAAGQEPSGGFHDWGMSSGPLVADPAVLQQLNDVWEVWQLDEYFMYETGHNEWNHYRALLDNGTPVTFDPPISFLYTHSQANDANNEGAYAGETVMLQYGGHGDLWGIPFLEVEDSGRWYPAFTLADGILVGPIGSEYVVKAIEKELSLRPSQEAITPTLQTGLDTAAALVLPVIGDWVNPADKVKPNVTDPPKVVAGVIQ